MMVRPDGELTQQARLLRTFAILGGAILAVIVGSRAVAAGPGGGSNDGDPTIDTYTVAAGDTLWAIASGVAAPGESTRVVVDEIRALNDLDSATLQVGQVLIVPLAP